MLTAALCKPLRTNHTVVYAKFFCCLLIMSAACFSNRNLSITMENTRGNGSIKKILEQPANEDSYQGYLI